MQEYYFSSEGCFITELSNSSEEPELSIAKARVEQGVSTSWHKLKNTTERYYILSGEGLAEVGESESQVVVPGDVVIIHPECRQRIINTGSTDLVFLAICTPRFLHENYVIDE